ncbi:MAG: hypothetical protein WC989_01800 [Micavibrio sp.]
MSGLKTGKLISMGLGYTLAFGMAAAYLHEQIYSYRYPAMAGEDYLKRLGYKHISGGGRDYSHPSCNFARHYRGFREEAQEERLVVCFNEIFFAHLPPQRQRPIAPASMAGLD